MARIVLRYLVAGAVLAVTGCSAADDPADATSPDPGVCQPACTDRVCGDDGCGGTCGTCGAGTRCSADGQACEPCTPSCQGATCGDDGCGGSCGTCAAGQVCNSLRRECLAGCQPDCAAKECGEDGCGGSCGACSGGDVCSAGSCTANPKDVVDPGDPGPGTDPGLPDMPLADVPLADVPPMDVPPTDVPIAEVPPTDAPPTDAPQTDIPAVDIPLIELGYDLPHPEVPDGTACPLALGYVDPLEDPVGGYHLLLGANGDRELEVKVTVCDAAVKGVGVAFEEVQDDLGLCSLESAFATTLEDGVASVRIGSPQDAKEGDCRFKACLDEDNCLVFNVHVQIKEVVPLVVGFEPYTGTHPLIRLGTVRIFKNAGTGRPNCEELKLNALPTATDARGPISLQTTAQFETLRDLEKDVHQVYTVLCVATEQGSSVPLAAGCVDDVGVEWNARTFVECPLEDIPPKIAGTYTITSTFDMVSGLPPTVANVINYIVDFFASPTATVLKLMCDPNIWRSGSGLQDLCSYVFADPAHPSVNDLTTVGEIMKTIIDSLLADMLARNCPYPENPELCQQIYFSARDIGDILRKFTLRSRMICSVEPDANGRIPLGGCREIWDTVILRWTLNKDCPPDDDLCGAMELTLASVTTAGDLITADIEVQLVEKYTKMVIAKHNVNLRYGALIDWALEKILLPQVFGKGGDGLPPVDSFEAMIGSLLAGRNCLMAGQPSCCEVFAANLSGQSGGAVAVNLIEGACDALIATGSEYIRSFLTSLDATPDNFRLGTPEGKPCRIYDTDQDMRFDALGRKPEADRCEWDATLTLGSYDYKPLGAFYGNLYQ